MQENIKVFSLSLWGYFVKVNVTLHVRDMDSETEVDNPLPLVGPLEQVPLPLAEPFERVPFEYLKEFLNLISRAEEGSFIFYFECLLCPCKKKL